MRSRAEWRVPVERGSRVLALAGLALALWRALSGLGAAPAHRAEAAAGLRGAVRDSLVALARAGEPVSWGGDVPPVVMATEPRPVPGAPSRVSILAPRPVLLADSIGGLDTLAASGSVELEGVVGALRAVDADQRADAGADAGADARAGDALAEGLVRAGAPVRRLLVLGRVGWEAKFTVAALEEAGWSVDARLRLSPQLEVPQGASLVPSLERHDAVIVLDSLPPVDATALARYVRAGGGVLFAGAGARMRGDAVTPLLPARAGALVPGERDAFTGGDPLHALARVTLAPAGREATVLDRRDGAATLVARRVERGRVAMSGEVERWRWRMQGEGDAVAAHRAAWVRLVGLVAATRDVEAAWDGGARDAARALAGTALPDAAPRATLEQRLGPPTSSALAAPASRDLLPTWAGAIILFLLTAEWASRRTRGSS